MTIQGLFAIFAAMTWVAAFAILYSLVVTSVRQCGTAVIARRRRDDDIPLNSVVV
jgi:hypothetical protein